MNKFLIYLLNHDHCFIILMFKPINQWQPQSSSLPYVPTYEQGEKES